MLKKNFITGHHSAKSPWNAQLVVMKEAIIIIIDFLSLTRSIPSFSTIDGTDVQIGAKMFIKLQPKMFSISFYCHCSI
jgi:hypothetical protein